MCKDERSDVFSLLWFDIGLHQGPASLSLRSAA